MLNVGVEHVGVTSGAVTPHSHDHEMAASPFVSARDKTLLLTLTPPPPPIFSQAATPMPPTLRTDLGTGLCNAATFETRTTRLRP